MRVPGRQGPPHHDDLPVTYFWAYLAGLLTLINPCVLPLVPIVIAAAFQSSRYGPLMLAAGLTISFAVVGVAVTAFGHLAGIDGEQVNRTAAVLMVLFGLVLLSPRAQALFARAASPLADRAGARLDRLNDTGAAGQLAVGVLLGVVWSPCVGPTLGGAIGLAASGEGLLHAGITMLAFGAGISTLLAALAYGSRELLVARRRRLAAWLPWAKPIMGAALLVVGLAVFFHLQRVVEIWLLDLMPGWLLDFTVSI